MRIRIIAHASSAPSGPQNVISAILQQPRLLCNDVTAKLLVVAKADINGKTIDDKGGVELIKILLKDGLQIKDIKNIPPTKFSISDKVMHEFGFIYLQGHCRSSLVARGGLRIMLMVEALHSFLAC
ncbi:MAG: hypothetical protein M3Y53_08035 [Thermoproteota archaeon]|nr:hypothetical protein [Thermoproteota archaeon]